MDEYADIYYVDTRNATTDHRTGSSSGVGSVWRPVPPPSRRPVVTTMPVSYPAPRPMAYPAGYPANYPGQFYPGQFYPGQQTALGSLFGGMPVGQILDLVATAFAALAPLPQAPTATRDASTDVGNLIMYQGALAEHAKRDERIRTIASLVGKLVA